MYARFRTLHYSDEFRMKELKEGQWVDGPRGCGGGSYGGVGSILSRNRPHQVLESAVAFERRTRFMIGVLKMRAIVVALPVILAMSLRLDADCAVSLPPCADLTRSTVVFFGQVQKAKLLHRDVGPGEVAREQEVEFNVLQALKGVKRGAFKGIFQLNSTSTTFTPGDRYLVYAYPREGRLSTGCSRTKSAVSESDAAIVRDELTTLRACGQSVR